MFFDYLRQLCGIGYHDKILLLNFYGLIDDNFIFRTSEDDKYELVYYEDVEKFRYLYETELKEGKSKYIVVLKEDIYLPYDIRNAFYCKQIDYQEVFPRLNPYVLEESFIFDLDLLYIAHENLYRIISSEAETQRFLSEEMFSKDNIDEYGEYLVREIEGLLMDGDYLAWSKVALLYSKLKYIKYRCGFDSYGSKFILNMQDEFQNFILKEYSSLSGYPSHDGPVLISRGLDYIFMNSKKVALIVMDGMSILDWLIISEGFRGISYKYRSTYAIIPTITSISRQSLLSGKLPVEMNKPFNLNDEEKMFIEKCMEEGYRADEIEYYRGYDFEIGHRDRCICTIINDIDDLVHSQRQGNMGMYNDVKLLSSSGKLRCLIERLYRAGFDVYITSDHGNVEATGIGNPRGMGVEIESKSKRTLILKDFADYKKIIEEFELIEYPAYFLPRDFKYLLCKHDKSFGVRGDISLSHGGISVEEIIVPFIEIEGVDV